MSIDNASRRQPVDSAPLEIATPRLILRPVAADDASDTAALVGPDVSRNLSTWPSPMSPDEALERIELSSEQRARGEAVDLAITSQADRRLMGWIGLARTADGTARLGYWLGAMFRGQGYMKEAAKAFLPVGASHLGVRRVQAFVLAANAPSVAVLKSLGFECTGEEAMFMEMRARHEQCLRFALTFAADAPH